MSEVVLAKITDSPVAVSQADQLRITSCPNCDYSREGLEDGAPCPECGMRYDPRAIVCQDDTGTDAEPITRKRRRWVASTLSLLPVLALIYFGGWRAVAWLLPWIFPLVIAVAIPSVCLWLTMDRRAHRQLWLLPEGFRLRPSTEAVAAHVANIYFIPVMLIGSAFVVRPQDRVLTSIVVAFAIVVAMLIWFFRRVVRRRSERITVLAGDYKLELTPWHALDEFDIRCKSGQRVTILFRRPVKLIGRLLLTHDMTLMEAPGDELKCQAIRERVIDWAGNRLKF